MLWGGRVRQSCEGQKGVNQSEGREESVLCGAACENSQRRHESFAVRLTLATIFSGSQLGIGMKVLL